MKAAARALPRQQRGVALLTAIVLFAVATILAAAITYNKAMAARRAAATFTLDQALQAGMAAEALAALALEDGHRRNKTETLVSQPWAQAFGPVEIEETGIFVQGQVEDLQGRFNLNNLVIWDQQANAYVADPKQLLVFQQLLEALDLETKWADLMVDWIDQDIAPYGPNGGEDTLYLSQTPSYRPPNTFITSTGDLLALPGFGQERYAKLAPYITAIPNGTTVNVCTGRGAVLDAVRADGQDEFQRNDPAGQRKSGCFPATSAYLNGIADPNLRSDVQSRIGTTSDIFRLTTVVRIGTAEFVLYSLLHRDNGNGQVRTLQRTFGSE
jgi:general secretion pathway protein K